MLERTRTYCTIKVYFINAYKSELFWNTLKPWYSEQVYQTLFVHYIEWFSALSNLIYLVNTQNGSWVLFTISRNLLFRGSLYEGLSVLFAVFTDVINDMIFALLYFCTALPSDKECFKKRSCMFNYPHTILTIGHLCSSQSHKSQKSFCL